MDDAFPFFVMCEDVASIGRKGGNGFEHAVLLVALVCVRHVGDNTICRIGLRSRIERLDIKII